jgi:hypothetical protein
VAAGRNQLSGTLDVSGLPALTTLSCPHNKLAHLVRASEVPLEHLKQMVKHDPGGDRGAAARHMRVVP